MSLDEAIEITYLSDTGRVRNHNEDCIAADMTLGMAVLADGMGGYKAGEVASAVAVTKVYRDTRDNLATLVPGQTDRESGLRYESLIMQEAIEHANLEVYAAAREHSEYSGMGTTIVASLFYDNRLTCAHVGDTRMYAVRNGKMTKLTVDHTVVQEVVAKGLYTEAEAKASINSSLVTRALGVDKEVEVDIQERAVFPGDLYLICSDGLTDMVNDAKIEKALIDHREDMESCAQRLKQLAYKGGGDDNISLILIKVKTDFKAEENWQTHLLDLFKT